MITTEKAFNLIKKNINKNLKISKVTLKNSLGRFLAEDIKSNINIPPQNNSAVDGFAINYSQKKNNSNLNYKIISEINAGDVFKKKIEKNQCVKVSTGSHLPYYLDTVIMLEDIKYINNNFIELPKILSTKKNVRKKGEDIKKGKIIIAKKSILRSQEIGLLASINKLEIKVFKKIKVAIISNGNELVNPGINKKNNQIYDSNRFMLMSLLKIPCINVTDCGILKDDYDKIKEKILKLKNKYDLIVMSGGASVGHKDYVVKIIKKIGKLVFSSLAIKPGRPMSFGILDNEVPILILPGNPVASFVTFNLFGNFLINCMHGLISKQPNFFLVKSNFNMIKKLGREEFLRGKLIRKNNELFVIKYSTEGAGILSSVVWSDGLIKLNSDVNKIKINDYLQFYPYDIFK
tara:strand:- start:2111 stop:3325 length:1215 start_codon:yes stop_codon:yes gene_type:complete